MNLMFQLFQTFVIVKQPILFLVDPSSWGCDKTYQCLKKETLSAPDSS